MVARKLVVGGDVLGLEEEERARGVEGGLRNLKATTDRGGAAAGAGQVVGLGPGGQQQLVVGHAAAAVELERLARRYKAAGGLGIQVLNTLGTGADGLLPMRALGREYFHYDREEQTLTGSDTGMLIGIGQRVKVRLAEAVPVTGGIALDLLEIDSKQVKPGSRSPAGRSPRRKATKAKRKGAKVKRKVTRTRR